MTPKQTKIVAAASVLSIALIALAWFVGISPQLTKANESSKAAAIAATETETLRTTLAGLQQKESEIDVASREYRDLARQFPSSFEPSEWVSMVLGAASSSGVTLTAISPSVPTLGAGAAGVPPVAAAPVAPVAVDPAAAPADGETLAVSAVSITAEGSAANLRSFLKSIGQLARPILIESTSLTTTEGLSTLTLTGRTFLMRELEDPAAAGQPDVEDTGTLPVPTEPPETTVIE